jgi:hypothetical protein
VRIASSGIDRPLKVTSVFGIMSGILFLSSLAEFNLKVGLDYGFLLTLPWVVIITCGFLVIPGGLLALLAEMSIEQRGIIAFFVFIASVLAIVGSLIFLAFIFGGPQ